MVEVLLNWGAQLGKHESIKEKVMIIIEMRKGDQCRTLIRV